MRIRISGLENDSIVDGDGFRFVIFVQGCPHHCIGCHNPKTHDFSGGTVMDTEDILCRIQKNPLLDGVTFSGGEPFCQAAALAEIGKRVHAMGLNIVTYTGYTFEELYTRKKEGDIEALLQVTDILVDGRFIKSLKTNKLLFRGSRNQRVIDCKRSFDAGFAILTEFIGKKKWKFHRKDWIND